MLRYLQKQSRVPVEAAVAGEDLVSGAPIYKDAETGEIMSLATGLCDDLVDIRMNYDELNAVVSPTERSVEQIAADSLALRVTTRVGDRFSTSEITATVAQKGDPLVASNGKFVRASGGAAYQWVYDYAYLDSVGATLHAIEKVPSAVAPAQRTVTYNANTGTGTQVDPRSPYYQGTSAVAMENTFVPPTDKEFSKWNTAANGSGTDYLSGAKVPIADSNIVLYAIWAEV